MDYARWSEWVVTFSQQHPVAAIGIAVALAVVAFLKPKPMFKLLLFCCFVVTVLYVLSFLGEGTRSGMSLKEKAAHRTEKALE